MARGRPQISRRITHRGHADQGDDFTALGRAEQVQPVETKPSQVRPWSPSRACRLAADLQRCASRRARRRAFQGEHAAGKAEAFLGYRIDWPVFAQSFRNCSRPLSVTGA
jgi:hypothetical protein